MWVEEGGRIVVDSESTAEHLLAMKTTFVNLAQTLKGPFGPVVHKLQELVACIKGRLAAWYTSLLSKDATYVVSMESTPSASGYQPQSGIRFVWERLVGHFVKLVENDFDNIEELLPQVHSKILRHMCTTSTHGVSTSADHPLVGYCKSMMELLPQVTVGAWSALTKAYLEALASLPPPPRFELPFLLFRTTLDRELNRVDVGVHTEAFESYLLGLKCINSCRQTQLQVAWNANLNRVERGVRQLSRDDKRRAMSPFALMMELNAVVGSETEIEEHLLANLDRLLTRQREEETRQQLQREEEKRRQELQREEEKRRQQLLQEEKRKRRRQETSVSQNEGGASHSSKNAGGADEDAYDDDYDEEGEDDYADDYGDDYNSEEGEDDYGDEEIEVNVDPKSGRKYYYNTVTQKAAFTRAEVQRQTRGRERMQPERDEERRQRLHREKETRQRLQRNEEKRQQWEAYDLMEVAHEPDWPDWMPHSSSSSSSR
jgi:hypothetical protein